MAQWLVSGEDRRWGQRPARVSHETTISIPTAPHSRPTGPQGRTSQSQAQVISMGHKDGTAVNSPRCFCKQGNVFWFHVITLVQVQVPLIPTDSYSPAS